MTPLTREEVMRWSPEHGHGTALRDAVLALLDERDAARAEVSTLSARCEQLREALERAHDLFDRLDDDEAIQGLKLCYDTLEDGDTGAWLDAKIADAVSDKLSEARAEVERLKATAAMLHDAIATYREAMLSAPDEFNDPRHYPFGSAYMALIAALSSTVDVGAWLDGVKAEVRAEGKTK